MSNAKGQSKKALSMLVLIGVVALGVGVYYKFFKHPSEFIYAGTLEATLVTLSAQLPSTIADIAVREGDHVTANQELITLKCDDIKVASRLANRNYERNLALFKTGTASEEALEQFRNRKDDVDLRLKWCSISSPINGTVLSRYHEPGEWTGPGMKLLTLTNLRDIWTYIYVPQDEIWKYQKGARLIGTLPELPSHLKRTFEGTVVQINDEAEFTPKNVQTRSERTRLVFGVKVSFLGANEDEILKPGMTIEITPPIPKA